ncbi:MAG: GNAT family N-acetyltransferase [Sphingomonadales bacterium]|nr:GNAT family N-acetyltransferase [Sphingomonadales bacterium]MDE2170536.1 GNAT family N-acetyltransferase [Sphingomonadales bacterium]
MRASTHAALSSASPSPAKTFSPIRLARAQDLAALSALKLICFRETFGPEGFDIPYPADDIARFEVDAYGLAKVSAELADRRECTWVVEDETGALVAYARVAPCKLPHDDVRDDDLELCQLYLRRSAQGAGLGKRLLDHALSWMEQRRPRSLWLGVWQGNLRAQHVYAGRGFAIVGDYRFAVGQWRDEEFIMRKRLARG